MKEKNRVRGKRQSGKKEQRERRELPAVEKQFRIGEVAKFYHLSVGSLRHYERAGLLEPEFVDPETGYRYYGARQFEVLNTIRYLRVLDMPLPEIADFLQNRDVEKIEEKLRQQKRAVEEKQRELQHVERKMEDRLLRLEEAKTAEFDRILLVEKPACRIVWMKLPCGRKFSGHRGLYPEAGAR